MSYILDALKKLEHEKAKKNRAGMVTISGALFDQEQPKPVAASGWKIALAVTIAVVLTFGATWYVLQPAKGGQKPVQQAAVPVPAPEPAPAPDPVRVDTPPVPPAPPVVSEREIPPAAPPVRPVPAAPLAGARPAQPRPTERGSTAAAPAPAATASEDAAALLTMQQLRARTSKEQPGQKIPADQVMAAPADIALSGIAWQDDRRARRAVVNGFLMQEGGLVSGARITEIFQDRVRFTLAGKYFEIRLASTGFPAAGK